MRTPCVAAILAALTIPTAAADLTPSALRDMLEHEEANVVVQSLDEEAWNGLLAHIEAGHRGWLDVVPLLAHGAYNQQARRLTVALSRGLTTNPAGVLSVMATTNYNPGDICGAVDADLSVFETVHFIDTALSKVASVMQPDLVEVRNTCLFALGAARISTLI
jgi:hypothetical protein